MRKFRKLFVLVLCIAIAGTVSVTFATDENVLVSETDGIVSELIDVKKSMTIGRESDELMGSIMTVKPASGNIVYGAIPFDRYVSDGILHFSLDMQTGYTDGNYSGALTNYPNVFPALYNTVKSADFKVYSADVDDSHNHLSRIFGNGEIYVPDSLATWGAVSDANKAAEFEANAWVRIDYFIDIRKTITVDGVTSTNDNYRNADVYINGTRIAKTPKLKANATEFKGLGFYIQKSTELNKFDNIFAEVYDKNSGVKALIDTNGAEMNSELSEIYLGFTEYLLQIPTKNNIEIVNAHDKTDKVSFTLENAGNTSVKLVLGEALEQGKYEIVFNGLQGVVSDKTESTEFFITDSDVSILDNISLYSYNGEKLDYTEKVPSGFTTAEISFSKAVKNEIVVIKDASGNEIETDKKIDGNKIVLALKNLLDSGDYIVEVTDGIKTYSIPFSVEGDATYGFFGQEITVDGGVAIFKSSVVKTDSNEHSATLVLTGYTENNSCLKLRAIDIEPSDFSADEKKIESYELKFDMPEGVSKLKGIITSEPYHELISVTEYLITE